MSILFKKWYIIASKKIDKYTIHIKDNYSSTYLYLTEKGKNKLVEDIKGLKEEFLYLKDEFDGNEYVLKHENMKVTEINQHTEYYKSDRYKTKEEAEQASKNLSSEWFNIGVNWE